MAIFTWQPSLLGGHLDILGFCLLHSQVAFRKWEKGIPKLEGMFEVIRGVWERTPELQMCTVFQQSWARFIQTSLPLRPLSSGLSRVGYGN